MNTQLKNIIKQAIDIHVHIGPEIIPRKYTLQQLVRAEKGKIGGFVLKNHFYPTTPFIKEVKQRSGLKICGGIVLNNGVGGLNPEAIYAANLLTDLPLIVWLPTINAENFLSQSEYEIPPEWVKNENFSARKSGGIKAIEIARSGKLTTQTFKVLEVIKNYNAILATGHISWQESEIVIREAKKIGVKNIVITHPIYQRINMPIVIQKKLASSGCFLEQSYSMYSIDKIPIQEIAKQIRAVGSEHIILSSDAGQPFSPSPSKALYNFGRLLLQKGITNEELYIMLVINPKKLLSIS